MVSKRKRESNKDIKPRKDQKKEPWFVYFIHCVTNNQTYVGATNNVERRVKQHGSSSRSAKYTKGKEWKLIAFLSGFENKIQALQFEKRWHMSSRPNRRMKSGKTERKLSLLKCSTMKSSWIRRLNQLLNILHMEKWTKRSPVASEVPLIVNWQLTDFTCPFQKEDLPEYIGLSISINDRTLVE